MYIRLHSYASTLIYSLGARRIFLRVEEVGIRAYSCEKICRVGE